MGCQLLIVGLPSAGGGSAGGRLLLPRFACTRMAVSRLPGYIAVLSISWLACRHLIGFIATGTAIIAGHELLWGCRVAEPD